ncbi:unnamed protein product [Clonostachys rosea f. rosea IK726]|uniref:Uncharacterized protein n=1 Tax=Clonostachys rosea f. rosea IK726 TaxID=1349383 RepID=A0ACA9TDE4_BIOOC|nr:unnamed protein product [Clonostachys rosea f. rosea IK726]
MSLDTQTSNDASNQAPDRHGTNLRQAAEPASAGSSLPTGTKGKRKHAQPHFATHGPDAISRHTPEGNSEKSQARGRPIAQFIMQVTGSNFNG